MSDQERISPYNSYYISFNTISNRQVMTIKKNINKISIKGSAVDGVPNSLNQCHESCMANIKKNC